MTLEGTPGPGRTTESGSRSAGSDLREFLAVLRHRKWSIGLITILTVASAMLFAYRQTPIYESTTKVLVKPTDAQQAIQGAPVSSLINLDNERALVESPVVAELAAGALDWPGSPEALLAHVSVDTVTNTQILAVTFSDPAPATAQGGARAFGEAYLEFRRQQGAKAFATAAGGVRRQIEDLQGQLARRRRELARAPSSGVVLELRNQIDLLVGQIAILQSQLARLSTPAFDPGEVVAPANLPSSPSSPDFPRTGVLALVVGLAMGLGAALLRERLDDRLLGREDFEEILGAPVLTVVPKVQGWRRRDHPELVSMSAPESGPAEAYRTIRTNLQFIARGGNLKVLSVTSPALGEGKTVTSANLAVALAQSGKRVIAVSCDLRKPRLHRFFGVPNDVGVTSILRGQSSMVEAAYRCGPETLRVIPSGPVPSNPAELLGSDQMLELLSELRRAADFVVIDTPPALAVSDSLVLAPLSDGVLFVVDAATTMRGAVTHVREQLAQLGANVVGGVFNNFDPARAKYYPSYYRYYHYSYRYRSEPERERSMGDGQRIRSAPSADLWR